MEPFRTVQILVNRCHTISWWALLWRKSVLNMAISLITTVNGQSALLIELILIALQILRVGGTGLRIQPDTMYLTQTQPLDVWRSFLGRATIHSAPSSSSTCDLFQVVGPAGRSSLYQLYINQQINFIPTLYQLPTIQIRSTLYQLYTYCDS